MTLIQALSGEALYPGEIHCAYDDPGYRESYECVFRCPVDFNESGNRMVLKSKQLDLPILQANKFNARMSEKLCEEILHKSMRRQLSALAGGITSELPADEVLKSLIQGYPGQLTPVPPRPQ